MRLCDASKKERTSGQTVSIQPGLCPEVACLPVADVYRLHACVQRLIQPPYHQMMAAAACSAVCNLTCCYYLQQIDGMLCCDGADSLLSVMPKASSTATSSQTTFCSSIRTPTVPSGPLTLAFPSGALLAAPAVPAAVAAVAACGSAPGFEAVSALRKWHFSSLCDPAAAASRAAARQFRAWVV